MASDSFRKRYLYKLFSNFIGFIANFAIACVVPRSLGPQLYGNFTFLSNFFQNLTGMFDASTSHAFYVKISQRQKEYELIKFYWNFVIAVVVLTFIFVTAVMFFDMSAFIWPNQKAKYIWMAFVWGVLTWISHIFEAMMDGYGLTVKAQKLSVIQKILKAILILSLFVVNALSLTTFFIYHFVILGLMIVMWGKLLLDQGIPLYPKKVMGLQKFKSYVREFYEYSSPLVVFVVASVVFGVLDVWLLERFAGSVQQGFYGLAFKIGSICFLFTASMTPLLMREFSISFDQGDEEKMRYQFNRYIPFFYTITAIISVFLSLQSTKISLILGGKEYAGASLAVALMVFHPIHKTYGQLSSSLLYATGRTKLHRNIGLIQMPITLGLTFILLAPQNLHGFNLGAFGLAIKMIVAQLFGVYARLWFNSKYLNLSFWRFVAHNVFTLAIVGIIAFTSTHVIDHYFSRNMLMALIISGCLYAVLITLSIYCMPWMVSMSREELVERAQLIVNKVLKTQR